MTQQAPLTEVAKLTEVVESLQSDIVSLRASLVILNQRLKRSRAYNIVATITVMALIGLGSYVGSLAISQRNNQDCVHRWASATAQRSKILLDGSNAKNTALDKAIRAAISQESLADKTKAITVYINASNEYNKLLIDNPLPPAPTFNC